MGWTFSGGPSRTGPEYSLAGATGRKLTVRRGAGASSSEFSFALPGRARIAGRIDELIDDVWLLNDQLPQPVVWRGRIGPASENGTPRSQAISYTAMDYREVLTRRRLRGATLTWANADPADAFWTVLTEEQARAGHDLGIVRGTVQRGGTVAAFNIETGKPIRDAFETFAGLGGGAHYDITPTSTLGLRADWWAPSRDHVGGSVVVRLGDAAVSYSRSVDPGQYGNAGYFTGQAPEGGGDAPPPIWLAVPDLASRPEGVWEYDEATDQTTAAGLASAAQRSLDEHQLFPVPWSCKLRRGWWKGPAQLWAGDVITWQCRIEYTDDGGSYLFRDVDVPLPVEEIALDFDRPPTPAEVEAHADAGYVLDETEPDVELTFGAPKRDAIKGIARRLSALERR